MNLRKTFLATGIILAGATTAARAEDVCQGYTWPTTQTISVSSEVTTLAFAPLDDNASGKNGNYTIMGKYRKTYDYEKGTICFSAEGSAIKENGDEAQITPIDTDKACFDLNHAEENILNQNIDVKVMWKWDDHNKGPKEEFRQASVLLRGGDEALDDLKELGTANFLCKHLKHEQQIEATPAPLTPAPKKKDVSGSDLIALSGQR